MGEPSSVGSQEDLVEPEHNWRTEHLWTRVWVVGFQASSWSWMIAQTHTFLYQVSPVDVQAYHKRLSLCQGTATYSPALRGYLPTCLDAQFHNLIVLP